MPLRVMMLPRLKLVPVAVSSVVPAPETLLAPDAADSVGTAAPDRVEACKAFGFGSVPGVSTGPQDIDWRGCAEIDQIGRRRRVRVGDGQYVLGHASLLLVRNCDPSGLPLQYLL